MCDGGTERRLRGKCLPCSPHVGARCTLGAPASAPAPGCRQQHAARSSRLDFPGARCPATAQGVDLRSARLLSKLALPRSPGEASAPGGCPRTSHRGTLPFPALRPSLSFVPLQADAASCPSHRPLGHQDFTPPSTLRTSCQERETPTFSCDHDLCEISAGTALDQN